MPFHICADEIIAFMMLFPFVGMFIRTNRDRVHAWFHTARGATRRFFKRECPHDDHEHK